MKRTDIEKLKMGETKLKEIENLEQKILLLTNNTVRKIVRIEAIEKVPNIQGTATHDRCTQYTVLRKIINNTLVEAELANTKEILIRALIEFEKL